MLANILRTDAHVHRALPCISEGGLAIKALARQHQEAIWARQLTVNRLRSVLLEFYPNALKAFPEKLKREQLAIQVEIPRQYSAIAAKNEDALVINQRYDDLKQKYLELQNRLAAQTAKRP